MRLFEESPADDEGHIDFLEMQLELPQSIRFENLRSTQCTASCWQRQLKKGDLRQCEID